MQHSGLGVKYLCPLRARALLTCIPSALQEPAIPQAGAIHESVNVWLSAGLKDGSEMARMGTGHHSWDPKSDLETKGTYIETPNACSASADAYYGS